MNGKAQSDDRRPSSASERMFGADAQVRVRRGIEACARSGAAVADLRSARARIGGMQRVVRRGWLGWVLAAGCVVWPTRQAEGVEPRLRIELGAAHALSAPQSREFGWGMTGTALGEFRLGPKISVQVALEALLLSEGTAPSGHMTPQGTGRALLGLAGARLYPLSTTVTHTGEPWISASAGYASTGSLMRFGFGADLGYDFWIERIGIGPFLSYRQIVQADDALRGEDARVGVFGVQGVWGPVRKLVTPERDWDRDGIVNDKDACPTVPEDYDGFEDTDGCPEADNDKDGIPDLRDQCPDEAEDFDGFEDTDGCPEVDNDKDGIIDKRDACPRDPEDYDGFEDEDGCPDLDNDKDEIPDAVDKCPNEPETFNGYADEDGCPDEISVRVVGAHIFLDDRIYFEWNRAEIRKESHPLVQRIGSLLKLHPEYLQISIEGHTDEMGSADYNLHLSEARAGAVRDFLIREGVAPERLVAVGFGESRPLMKGKTERAAVVNRRVEFVITKRRSDSPPLFPPPTVPQSADPPPATPAVAEPAPSNPPKGGKQ
jgi:outer membrane protein OmpA-like peptidoglycan-associated protein